MFSNAGGKGTFWTKRRPKGDQILHILAKKSPKGDLVFHPDDSQWVGCGNYKQADDLVHRLLSFQCKEKNVRDQINNKANIYQTKREEVKLTCTLFPCCGSYQTPSDHKRARSHCTQ